MFTPPPSPRPLKPKEVPPLRTKYSSDTLSPPTIPHAMSSYDQKRRTGRQFRWAVLIVPLVLIFITASSRYITHPAAFDIFASPTSEWSQLLAKGKDWRLHKRHPSPEPDNDDSPPAPSVSVSGSSIVTSPSPTTVVQQPVPTIPSAPPTLPTPFPQPYEPQLTLNFSSVTCLSFFTNMTQSTAFRPCRPFSLLSQSSAAFINAQSNLTLMNTLVWGTCNTNPGINQCIANMGWFAESLKTQCEADLKDRNTLAVDTLTALNAYKPMYDAACMQNPTANTYCYMDAVAEPDPADLYLYQLPLGMSLPHGATGLTCSPCSKSVLGLYASALGNESLADDLTGLKDTYESSVKLVNAVCGADFAKVGVVNGVATITPSCGPMSIVAVALGIWTLVI